MTSTMTAIGLNILSTAGLVVLSGLFSGLTLGLMSLDIVGLQILVESGHPADKTRAKTILPVRRNGNLLLCSLLIGNTFANALLAIFLAGLTSGVLGLVLSSGLIVVFGEIVPQAICSRYGLAIGAKTIYLTRFLIFCLFLLAYPISKVLDMVLGKEMGNLYNRDELKTLISLHVENPEARLASGLTREDSHIMTAVLEYQVRRVKDVMTPFNRVFKLDSKTKLNFQTMFEIHQKGYTRIPVFEDSESNIIGILYSKDLILINPDDEVELKSVLAFHGLNHVQFIVEDLFLKETLLMFKSSYSHMMIVISSKKNTTDVKGVITLEDVIEEVLNDEIVDESDRYRDNTHIQALSYRSSLHNRSEFLKLFGHHLKNNSKTTTEETTAISAFLKSILTEFSKLQDGVLIELIQGSSIVDTIDNKSSDQEEDTTGEGYLCNFKNDDHKPSHFIYRLGELASYFTLVLQGRIQIEAGHEKFASEVGPLGVLGTLALTQEQYIPDFNAFGLNGFRVLKIERKDYLRAIEKTKMYSLCKRSKEMK